MGRRPSVAARKRGARRALDYIVACSRHPGATRKVGHELLFCLYNTAVTSAEPSFASDAWTAGARRAWRWHAYTRRLAARRASGDRDALLNIMHGLYGSSHFGYRATVCSSCGRKLVVADAFEIWQHALVVTHAGE